MRLDDRNDVQDLCLIHFDDATLFATPTAQAKLLVMAAYKQIGSTFIVSYF